MSYDSLEIIKIYLKDDFRLKIFKSRQFSQNIIQFKSSKFFFQGIKIDQDSSYKFDSDPKESLPINYVGTMLMNDGCFYIGYFDQDFHFSGEGMFFFSIGAYLRGSFLKGKIHDQSLICLPSLIILEASFDEGRLLGSHKKINLDDYSLVIYNKSSPDQDYQQEVKKFDDNQLGIFRQNYCNLLYLENQEQVQNGINFGTFLMNNQTLYSGFLMDQMPIGWGLSIKYDFSKQESLYPFTWDFKNWTQSNSDVKLTISMNKKHQVIVLFEDYTEKSLFKTIYNTTYNKFSFFKNNQSEIVQEEGIKKKVIGEIFDRFFQNEQKKDFQKEALYLMIFNMQNFDDILFFYLYGALNEEVIKLYSDEFEILKEQFFQTYTNYDSKISNNSFDKEKQVKSLQIPKNFKSSQNSEKIQVMNSQQSKTLELEEIQGELSVEEKYEKIMEQEQNDFQKESENMEFSEMSQKDLRITEELPRQSFRLNQNKLKKKYIKNFYKKMEMVFSEREMELLGEQSQFLRQGFHEVNRLKQLITKTQIKRIIDFLNCLRELRFRKIFNKFSV